MKTSLSCYNPAVYHILYKTVKLSIGLHESLLYVIVSVSVLYAESPFPSILVKMAQ